jgi:SAM-dependent methyltransferase
MKMSRQIRSRARHTALVWLFTPFQWLLLARVARVINSRNAFRRLEIGPGPRRLPGFETLSVVGGRSVDYIADASKRLPFRDQTFDLIYASHIIEHIPWYLTANALREWVRILKCGGRLEVWTPDGLKIARAFVAAEDNDSLEFHADGWWRFNESKDPCVWMAGRCFSYGDGSGRADHPNWHRALFSERHLRALMTNVGLIDIRRLERADVRGHDHGWINLGLVGTKP